MLPKHLLTEGEARTKWCPAARVHVAQDEGTVCNRLPDGKPDQGALCVASDCMAWRWAGGAYDYEIAGLEDKSPRGSCGLAGIA